MSTKHSLKTQYGGQITMKKTLISLGLAAFLGCVPVQHKQDSDFDEAVQKVLSEKIHPVLLNKGEAGYDPVAKQFESVEAYKKLEEKLKAAVEFQLEGRTAIAFTDTDGVVGVGPEDTVHGEVAYDIKNLVELASDELKESIKTYDETVKLVFEDGLLSHEEKAGFEDYLGRVVAACQDEKNPLAKLHTRQLIAEISGVLAYAKERPKRKWSLAVGFDDGKDIGLTSNPQYIDLEEDELLGKLKAHEKERAMKQAAGDNELVSFTPGKSNKEDANYWTEIDPASSGKAIVETDKVGLDYATRISSHRYARALEDKGKHGGIVGTWLQGTTPGYDIKGKLEDALYGDKPVQ